MPSPIVFVSPGSLECKPHDGQFPGQPMVPVNVPTGISCTAWAVHPATRIGDGNGGTNPIQCFVDGAAVAVTITQGAGTGRVTFNVPITAANTGNAAGALLGHRVQIIVFDDQNNSTTIDLVVLRLN